MMSSEQESETTPMLDRAITAMRAELPVRDAWRDALHRELLQIAAAPEDALATSLTSPSVASQRAPRWHFTPVSALAAAAAFMMLGAVTNEIVQRNVTAGSASTYNDAVALTATSSAIGVRFSVMARDVRRVSLVGDFNGWDANASPLQLARDGQTWTTLLPLAAGRHAYAFVIDGQVVRDPAAPQAPEDDFGVPNSLLLVSAVR